MAVDGTCGGYFCGDGGCATSCQTDTDCIANYVCTFPNPNATVGFCQLLDGPLCNGHDILRVPTDAGKVEQTCADNFACPADAGACALSCEAETDCAAPYACDQPNHVCVPPLTPPPVPGCTACTVAESDPGTGRDAGMAALGVLAAVALRRRRRGWSRAHAWPERPRARTRRARVRVAAQSAVGWARAARLRELRRSGGSEPGGEGVTKAAVRTVSDPRDVSIGPNQHGSGSRDRAEHRELPHTSVSSVDPLNPVRPWSDVEGAGLTEIEQYRSR